MSNSVLTDVQWVLYCLQVLSERVSSVVPNLRCKYFNYYCNTASTTYTYLNIHKESKFPLLKHLA